MASGKRAFKGGTVVAAAVVAAALSGFATPAAAAPAWIKRALGGDGRRAPPPPVARYLSDDGGLFILDRSTRLTLLKFDGDPEIWVLVANRGPRGDMIYKNDVDEPLVRATKLGGLTVFTTRRPEGSAAALVGASGPLRLQPLGPLGLFNRLYQASLKASRAARHAIGFEAPDADAGSDGLIADAAVVTGGAMASLSAKSGGRALMARLDRVVFAEGAQPAANLHGGILAITVVPSQGIAGRPSSGRILRAVGAR